MQNALAKSGLKLDQKKCSLFLAILLNLPLNHQPKKAENGATTKNQQQIFIPMYSDTNIWYSSTSYPSLDAEVTTSDPSKFDPPNPQK